MQIQLRKIGDDFDTKDENNELPKITEISNNIGYSLFYMNIPETRESPNQGQVSQTEGGRQSFTGHQISVIESIVTSKEFLPRTWRTFQISML